MARIICTLQMVIQHVENDRQNITQITNKMKH